MHSKTNRNGPKETGIHQNNFRFEQTEECKVMAKNNYEKTHCSRYGEWLKIEGKEVYGS
jgi:hypothetical protein